MQESRSERPGSQAQPGVEYHPPTLAVPMPAVGAEPASPVELSSSAADGAEATGAPPASQATGGWQGVRVLCQRIDWLTVAFKVALSEHVCRDLVRRLEVADVAHRTSAELAGHDFELRRVNSGQTLLLRNASASVKIDPKGPEGWTVSVDFTGGQMMVSDVDAACALAERLAGALGSVQGSRVRRLDLAADIGGWSVRDIDDRAFVKSSRAKLDRDRGVELDKSDSPVQRRFRRGEHVTGYSICPGNPIMCVIYDKREELTIKPDKRAAEEHRWREAGWDGAAPVTRVEFRFRSLVLHELGARDGLNAFRQKLDALWRYASRWWLRLVELGAATRLSRCPVTPEWAAVQSVVFVHQATPAVRTKMRKGASAAQVFGAALSAVAGASLLLGPVLASCESTGRPLEIHELVAKMTTQQQEATVRAVVGGIVSEAGGLVVVDLLERLGTERAARWILTRQEAARARFSECGPAPGASRAAA